MAVLYGHVYFLQMPLAAKGKLVVPAFVLDDDRVRFFMINTNRTEFQEKNPYVAKHVLPLDRKDYMAFLTHDSWLCCDEVVGGWNASAMEKVKGCYRSPLTKANAAAVREVMKESRLYSDSERAKFLKQWPD